MPVGLPEAEVADPVVEVVRAELEPDRHRPDVGRVLENVGHRVGHVAALVRLLDRPVRHLDARRQVERRVRGNQALLERPRNREGLERRPRLVVEARRHVAELIRVERAGLRWVEAGPVRHREDLGVARVHDDRRGAVGVVGLPDPVEHALGLCLQAGVQGQLEVGPRLGALDRVALELVAEPVAHHLALAVGAVERLVLRLLEPGQALVVDPDRADHLARELALRVDPPAVRQQADAGPVEVADLLRLGEVDLAGDVREARAAIGDRLQDVLLRRAVEDLAELVRGRVGILDLVRGREHGRRVLGDRQRLAVAVVDRPAGSRDLHRLGLLALGLGAQRAAVDALDPGGADDDQCEEDDECCEKSSPSRRSIRFTERRRPRRRSWPWSRSRRAARRSRSARPRYRSAPSPSRRGRSPSSPDRWVSSP